MSIPGRGFGDPLTERGRISGLNDFSQGALGDLFNYIYGRLPRPPTSNYTDWQPVLQASGGDPNIGDAGVAAGAFVKVGKLVHARALIRFAGSGITQGSGYYNILLPVEPFPLDQNSALGSWSADDGGTNLGQGTCLLFNTDQALFSYDDTSGGSKQVTGGSPWTFVASGFVSVNLVFQAA